MAIMEEMHSYLSDKEEFEKRGYRLVGYKYDKKDVVYFVKKLSDSK